ncbi:hypothetical protein JW868_00695 [Candidatus Woesearchaeota archaeon]|nr:hypothetical protein [Candidatus Woesearchaeota archaeon]
MRVAVASEGNTVESKVCETAGRAPYYLIFENKKLIMKLKNPFTRGGGGVGFSVVQMLHNQNIDLVIAGNFGRNMLAAMQEKGIKFKEIHDKRINEISGGRY